MASLAMEMREELGLEDRLKESDRNIDEAWHGLTKRSLMIGWEGNFIKRNDGWRLLGFEDEKHYRARKGIGRSTWYKMVGLAERFPDLTREQFMSMTIENAEQLAVAPRSTRHNLALVRKAATMSARDFEGEMVAETAARENKPAGEVYVTMKWRIKQAQREVIERGLEDWQHEHGIDDEGYALELMIAEFRERPTLVGFMTESIPRWRREIAQAETAEDMAKLRGLFALHLQEMDEILKICCGEPRAA